ncbi:MAG TPA: methyltransferase domain-containing protein [Azospirillaceae bacterium]|nr:methyltransferase domain-containing protein [Azospirillaceae bacterium]
MQLSHFKLRLGPDTEAVLEEARIRFIAWWEGYDLDAFRRWMSARKGADLDEVEVDYAAFANKGLDRHGKPLWTATRIGVAEKIWGEGFVSPGGQDYISEMVRPLGLNPAMSVLDLHAGLGGAARIMVDAFGTWITGLEPNPLLAAEGMERSKKLGMTKQAPIVPYDPESFKYNKRVDCVFARELFFAIKEKDRLFDGIERALKPRGQLLYTDYVFVDEPSDAPAITNWRATEPLAPSPWTLAQHEGNLKRRNLDVRVAEDVTDAHRAQVVSAIQKLSGFLGEHTVMGDTKQAVLAEVNLWAARIAAFEAGLRCYRFYALKPSS